MTKTSVVILNYNGEKFLRQFLPSVVEYSGPAEIIVADNASTDNSINVVRQNFPTVRLISLEKNYGFCGGYNRALKQVEADYFVLLNSDVEVTPTWLDPMIKLLDKDSRIAAVQPKILSWIDKKKFEYAGAGGGFIDSLGYPFCRGRVFNTIEEDHGQYDDERPVFWATGACLMIRSSVFHKFGGFDDDFFAHMEEIDLCWKIARTNQRVLYCGKSTVYHVGAGTLGYESPRKTYLNFKNNLTLLVKHMTVGELVFKLPFRFVLDWLAALVFLFQGKSKSSVSVLDAQISFLQTFNKTLQKRKALQREFPTYSKINIYRGMILLKYYFGNKKHLGLIVPNRAASA
jgi:GT2 family glycosyltransferase